MVTSALIYIKFSVSQPPPVAHMALLQPLGYVSQWMRLEVRPAPGSLKRLLSVWLSFSTIRCSFISSFLLWCSCLCSAFMLVLRCAFRLSSLQRAADLSGGWKITACYGRKTHFLARSEWLCWSNKNAAAADFSFKGSQSARAVISVCTLRSDWLRLTGAAFKQSKQTSFKTYRWESSNIRRSSGCLQDSGSGTSTGCVSSAPGPDLCLSKDPSRNRSRTSQQVVHVEPQKQFSALRSANSTDFLFRIVVLLFDCWTACSSSFSSSTGQHTQRSW